MAFSGFVDYYRGDTESASWCVTREHIMADELANIETEIETQDRSTTLKFTKPDPQPPVEMAAWRAECSEILATTSEIRAYANRPQLPSGTRPTYAAMRWAAVQRQREREE